MSFQNATFIKYKYEFVPVAKVITDDAITLEGRMRNAEPHEHLVPPGCAISQECL